MNPSETSIRRNTDTVPCAPLQEYFIVNNCITVFFLHLSILLDDNIHIDGEIMLASQ